MTGYKILYLPTATFIKSSSFADRYHPPFKEYVRTEDLHFQSLDNAKDYILYKYRYEKYRLYEAANLKSPSYEEIASFSINEFQIIEIATNKSYDIDLSEVIC